MIKGKSTKILLSILGVLTAFLILNKIDQIHQPLQKLQKKSTKNRVTLDVKEK